MSRKSRPYRPIILTFGVVGALAVFGMASPASALVELNSVPVGSNPYSVGLSPDGTYALVPNEGDHTVSRIDLATAAVTATINVPSNPVHVAFTPDGSKAYVTSWVGDAITVIDTATNGTTQVTGIAVGSHPFGIVTTSDGSEAIVTEYGNGHVLTVSTATNAVTHDVNSGAGQLQGIALDPTGATAYVGSPGGWLESYDIATNTFDPGTVTGLGWINNIAVAPDGSEVWLTNDNLAGSITILDVASDAVVLTMTGYQYPDGIQFSPDGSVVYIAEDHIDTVTALDFFSLDALYAYPTGNGPYGVTLSPDGRRLYVPNYSGNNVSVIGTIQRITGPDRFEVAVSISQRAYPGTSNVVFIANGLNYPDALSAGPVAAGLHGPLLLTSPTSIPASVLAEVQRLQPAAIYIVGGPNSVSDAVKDQLDALPIPGNPPVTRAGGADRYEASRNINNLFFGNAATVYITTGRNFPDALSAGAAGAVNGVPVLLVDGLASSLDPAVLNQLTAWGTVKVKIAGGPASVSPGIQSQLETLLGLSNVERLTGATRYDASLAINVDAFATASTAYIATGQKFPDALAGSALAAADGAPLFVVPGTCVPQGMLDAMDAMGVGEVVLLGGPASLTQSVFSLVNC